MVEDEAKKIQRRPAKKVTKTRLKNIGLYYLERFESSVDNLRQVLTKRVNDYAFQNPGYDKSEALGWIEELLADFERYGYLNDSRYAELKIRDYLAAGKSARY
ncbi:MAG: RecX family transcriptional regulator, partial [Alphaproteobacteria bacterium]